MPKYVVSIMQKTFYDVTVEASNADQAIGFAMDKKLERGDLVEEYTEYTEVIEIED